MYGDSTVIDDEIWGWAHHLGYKIANDQMPFEIVNLARTGGVICSPALDMPKDAVKPNMTPNEIRAYDKDTCFGEPIGPN